MDAATAANVLSVFTIAIAVGGILYSRVWIRLFRNLTTAVGIIFLVVGLALAYLSIGMQSMPLMYVATVIYGFGFEMNNSHLCQLLPLTSVPSAAAFLLGLMYAFINFGSFLAGIVTPALSGAIFGANLMADWMLGIPGLAICAVLMLILCVATNKYIKGQAQTA